MSFSNPFDVYSDSRTHPPPGPSRNARLAKVTLPGGGLLSKGEDGRIAVAGRESLRILRISDTSRKIESSKNLWEGSGLKIDCASTDVAWAYGAFNNKILTSARNGELIIWDLSRSHSKYERKTKEHLRSIHAMSVSRVAHHYCITGSADADFRVWDLRDIQSSIMRIHNPSAVRRVIFSPCTWNPLFVLVGMDNGTIHRWDLKMGQRGLLDRLPVAHMAPITSLDWYSGGQDTSHAISISAPHSSDDSTSNTLGWVASAGWDRCVRVWNLTSPEAASHMPNKPTYTLHTSYPIRRVLWRPGFECELAVVSHADFTVSSHVDHLHSAPSSAALTSGFQSRVSSGLGLDTVLKGFSEFKLTPKEPNPVVTNPSPVLDAVEIWDVRRSWIPKWSVTGTSAEGGVTDIEFADPHTLLAQNTNGTFTQTDMRDTSKPLDAISRTSATWTPDNSLAFVTDNIPRWEIPYDDVHPERLGQEISIPKSSIKQIGDPCFRPTTQKFGAFSSAEALLSAESFKQLASSYIIDGDNLPDLCTKNMQAALTVGKPHIAQMWMLMSTTLTERVPSLPPTPPQSPPKRVTSLSRPSRQTTDTPTQSLRAYKFPSSASTSRSPEVPRPRVSPRQLPIAFERSSKSARRSPSMSNQRSPYSSNSSSPLHRVTTLPRVTPRRTTLSRRRESVDSSVSTRHSVLLRRQSIPTPSHSASPIDKNSAGVKNAGEGVLSDSDSSSEHNVESEEEETVGAQSTDEEAQGEEEETVFLPFMAVPSPSSRVAQDQPYWTDQEEEDEVSPSPNSSDTESEGNSTSRRKLYPNKMRRLSSSRVKIRSRSSTLASLPAPSRINSVTMHSQSHITPIKANDRLSQTLPELGKGSETPNRYRSRVRQDTNDVILPTKTSKAVARREDIVVLHENRMLEYSWEVLRQAFEEFVATGDMQTAATMAVIAPEQLKVSLRRRLHIYDAYMDQLQKFQLYTTAAYFRKHSKIQQIKNMTLIETTIYTTCGKCKKPLIRPAGRFKWKRPTYSYCLGCKSATVICSICRLPVRTLLFQCSICHHGGHQSCYRQFYLNQPLVNLPPSQALKEYCSQSHAKTSSDQQLDSRDAEIQNPQKQPQAVPIRFGRALAGHPCAAGCGHFCWATSK